MNYGGDGLIPLDKWFGTWHDGTKEGDASCTPASEKKRERMNAEGSNPDRLRIIDDATGESRAIEFKFQVTRQKTATGREAK